MYGVKDVVGRVIIRRIEFVCDCVSRGDFDSRVRMCAFQIDSILIAGDETDLGDCGDGFDAGLVKSCVPGAFHRGSAVAKSDAVDFGFMYKLLEQPDWNVNDIPKAYT